MYRVWKILKRAIQEFIDDEAMTLGGALAFFTALSLAPLLIIVLAVAGFLWQEGEVRAEIVKQANNLIGPGGAQVVDTVMREAGRQDLQGAAALIGVATLLFGATSVFAQLQYSLNRIWNVEARPGGSMPNFLRKRLLSLGLILAIAFLLVVSLVASATLSYIAASARITLPGGDRLWGVVDFVASLLLYTGVFTLVHRGLPDVKVPWKDCLVGGAVTAVLFAIGKELLGLYLGRGTVASAYGAAGSFFVVLLWVYYSSLILFVGAEITQAIAEELGHPVVLAPHARHVPRPPREQPA